VEVREIGCEKGWGGGIHDNIRTACRWMVLACGAEFPSYSYCLVSVSVRQVSMLPGAGETERLSSLCFSSNIVGV
jgi:hypothetical protein